MLPKLRMHRNHPITQRHTPVNQGGVQLPHFYVIQGTIQIKQAIKHIKLQSSLRQLLQICLRCTQLIAGTITGILTETKIKLPYVPDKWWMKVRKFLHFIQGNIQMDDEYVVPPLQDQDHGFMDKAIEQGWMAQQFKQINACRLYLQVQYVLELTTDRTEIPMSIQDNTERRKDIRTTLDWSIQNKPGKQAWKA